MQENQSFFLGLDDNDNLETGINIFQERYSRAVLNQSGTALDIREPFTVAGARAFNQPSLVSGVRPPRSFFGCPLTSARWSLTFSQCVLCVLVWCSFIQVLDILLMQCSPQLLHVMMTMSNTTPVFFSGGSWLYGIPAEILKCWKHTTTVSKLHWWSSDMVENPWKT